MDIFEQIYKQLIMQDEVSPQTQPESQELTYLKKVLNKYWDVDDETILQIDKIINEKDPTTNKSKRFRQEKIDAIKVLKKCYYKNMDVVEYLVDNNGKILPQLADYVSKEGEAVQQRVHIPFRGYVSATNIIDKLKEKDITINEEILSDICSIIPSKQGRGVGGGEVLCKTLLNISQTNSGDGALNGDEKDGIVQIKSYKARIKGAKKYGLWNTVVDRLEPFLQKNKNIPDYPSPITCQKLCDWIFDKRNQLNISVEDKVTLKKAFGGLFIDSEAFEKVNQYYDAFINALLFGKKKEEWGINFLRLSLEYYRVVDNWRYMILIDNENKIFKGLYISNDIPDIMKHIKVKNWPSSGDDRVAAICIGYKEPEDPTNQASK